MAQSAVLYARQQALAAHEQARVAEFELKTAAGMPEDARIETVEPDIAAALPTIPAEDLYRRTLETHPEIRQAEARVAAREFHVEAEKGEAYPKLDVISQYAVFSRTNNYQDFFNRFTRNNFLLGLSVQVPLFSGFRTGARVAQSRQEAAESRFELQRLKNELRRNLERALSAVVIARGARELADSHLHTARELLSVNESLLESGRLAPKDVDDARNQVHQRELAEIEAARALFEREIDLLRTTGAAATLAK
jgi:adhesin transport system outer membrane protein